MMRVYGRVPIDPRSPKDGLKWVVVTTTPQGFNDDVYIVALAQLLKLNLNESPFYGNYGIPAHQSVMQQVMPDYYVFQAQNLYAPFFASLVVYKIPDPAEIGNLRVNVPAPHYRFQVITHYGFKYPPIDVRGAPQ
jgi:hypothetical protein